PYQPRSPLIPYTTLFRSYMMRKKDAETDPNQQVRETIGSGPFLYNRDETRPGNRHVYDRNPNYVPRAEPSSGMAGGKVVKLDRRSEEHTSELQSPDHLVC